MHQDLLEAAQHGNIEAFQRMEGDGSFDINLADEYGSTYLMFASGTEHLDLIKYVISFGQRCVN